MQRKRLKPEHPLYQKFMALCEKAEELNLCLDFFTHYTIVSDGTSAAFLEDNESGARVDSFPPDCEFKLILDEFPV